MVLYSAEALSDWDDDISEDGLVDQIYEAFEDTNTAMVNSKIELDINVVHVQQVRDGVDKARHHGPWGRWLRVIQALSHRLGALDSVVHVDGRSCVEYGRNMHFCYPVVERVVLNGREEGKGYVFHPLQQRVSL